MVITQDEFGVTIHCPDCVFCTMVVHEHPEMLDRKDQLTPKDREV